MVQIQVLKAFLSAHIKTDRGASLVEYALLVGLIALVCIVGVAALGGKTSKPLNSIAGAL
jgi:pilus assembly protein Flp/PilA